MTTQSGRHYRGTEVQVIENMAAEATGVNDIMRILLEDRRNRELLIEDERRQRERAIAEEREQLQQMDVLRRLVKGSQQDVREGRPAKGHREGELKPSKFNNQDDIEAYLTTFERVMQIYKGPEDRSAVRLASQLTGKAQSAYAAMGAEDALDYWALKEAVLRCYDISEDTYKHRFQRTEKEEESVSELVVRLNDVFRKWTTRECDTVEQLADLMAIEQLLNTLPVNVKIWVEERRPKTCEGLACDFLKARKQMKLAKPAGPEDKTAKRSTRR